MPRAERGHLGCGRLVGFGCSAGSAERGKLGWAHLRAGGAMRVRTHRLEGQRGLPVLVLCENTKTHAATGVHVGVKQRRVEAACAQDSDKAG